MRSDHVFDDFVLDATLCAIARLDFAVVHLVDALALFAFPVFTAKRFVLILLLLFLFLGLPLVIIVLELTLCDFNEV